MTTIKSKDFTVRRTTCIALGDKVKRLIALTTSAEYRVVRDDTRNKAFPDAIGYKVVHADPIRTQTEGALYYVDFHPKTGELIFVQGNHPINMRAVYSEV